MEPEQPEQLPSENKLKNILKRAFLYFGLLAFGFVASAVWRGGSAAIDKTANLVSQTGKEVLSPAVSGGVNFNLPLKKSAKTKIVKAVVPAAIPLPPKVSSTFGDSVIQSATSSASSTALDENNSATSTATSSGANPPAQSIASAPKENIEPAPIVSRTNFTTAKLLIFEIQITGGPGNSEQDFIKIYNPTSYAVNAGGWKLRKRSKTGGDASIKVIPDGTAISSGAVLTWANSKDNFAGTVGADISSTATISADNSIAILDADGKIIDAVAWGGGTGQFVEGAPYPNNPEAGQILRRKTGGANLQDTDNNSADFSV